MEPERRDREPLPNLGVGDRCVGDPGEGVDAVLHAVAQAVIGERHGDPSDQRRVLDEGVPVGHVLEVDGFGREGVPPGLDDPTAHTSASTRSGEPSSA